MALAAALPAVTQAEYTIPSHMYLPAGYTAYTIDELADIANKRTGSGDMAFCLSTSLSENSAAQVVSTASGNRYITSRSVNNLSSLYLSGAASRLFEVGRNKGLTFEALGTVSLSGVEYSYSGSYYDDVVEFCSRLIKGNAYSRLQLSENERVSLSGNQNIVRSYNDVKIYGGAVYSGHESTLLVSGNSEVNVSDNSARGFGRNVYVYGAGIYGGKNRLTSLNGNDKVIFSGNSLYAESQLDAYACGAALYGAEGRTLAINWNGEVLFSGNRITLQGDEIYAYGAAVYAGEDGRLDLSWNDSVIFEDNVAVSQLGDWSYSYGGAVYSGGEINITGNGKVLFSGNEVQEKSRNESWGGAYGGAIYASKDLFITDNDEVTFTENSAMNVGGAIVNYQLVNISNNGVVIFSKNTADSISAIDAGNELVISGNDKVVFSKNKAEDGWGAVWAVRAQFKNNAILTFSHNETIFQSGAVKGGALFVRDWLEVNGNGTVTFSGNSLTTREAGDEAHDVSVMGGAVNSNSTSGMTSNKSILFSGNSVTAIKMRSESQGIARGGALSVNDSGEYILNSNGSVTFTANRAKAADEARGGAIFVGEHGSIKLHHNGNVLFEKNTECQGGVYCLRGLYSLGSASFSAKGGASVAFRDSFYVDDELELNHSYKAANGTVIKQTGDIILTGYYTESHLREMKGGVSGTEQEILASRTSEVDGITTLYAGRLRVEAGAIFRGVGFTAASGSTLRLSNAQFRHHGSDIIFNNGSTLALNASNILTGNLRMLKGSKISFTLSDVNMTDASLIFNGGSLTLRGKINLSFSGTSKSGNYKLITGIRKPSSWTSTNVGITNSGSWDVDFSDLVWKDNTLWLSNRSYLSSGVWKNRTGNRMWSTASANWDQDGFGYAFRNGAEATFYNTGFGNVTLSGDLAPSAVTVHNAAGKFYVWGGSGRLTGSMKLTKKGAGGLTINTANTYTGGTELHAGTLKVGTTTALGSGKVTLKGGTLQMSSLAMANAIELIGSATIGNGSAYKGNFTMTSGTLKSGSTLGIISGRTATLKGGTLSGVLKGAGKTIIAGKVTLKGGSIKTNQFTMGSGATFTTGDSLTLSSMSATGGTLNLTSSTLKPISITNKFSLSGGIDLNLRCSLTKGTSYKLITYGSTNLTSSSNLEKLLGLTGAGCKLTYGSKSITIRVTDSAAWSSYIAANAGTAAASISDETSDMLAAYDGGAETSVDFTMNSALVQSAWGTVHASRAFADALANRMQNATTLGESKSTAVWMSVLGGAGRLSWNGAYAGSDWYLSGAAFGMQQQLTTRSTLGLAIGNSWGKVSSFGAPAIDQDTLHAALYGDSTLLQREKDSLTLSWSAAWGRTDGDITLDGVKSEWEQKAVRLNARTTYGYALSDRSTLSGFAGLEYLATDSGDIAPGAATGSVQNLRAEIGVGVGQRIADRSSVYAELSFVGDMVRHNPTSEVGGLRSKGANPGRVGINFSIGGSHAINEHWSVNAAYNMELMQHANSHSANIGFSRAF